MTSKKSSTRPGWGAQINDRQCKSLICEESENDTFRFPWSKKSRLDFFARLYRKLIGLQEVHQLSRAVGVTGVGVEPDGFTPFGGGGVAFPRLVNRLEEAFTRLSRKLMTSKKSSTRPGWGAQINDRQCKSLICEESENDTFRFPQRIYRLQKVHRNFLRGYQQ